MKKLFIFLVVAVLLLGATAAFAVDGPHAQITSQVSVCMVCHLPHSGGNAGLSGAPLWAKKFGPSGVASYTTYGTTVSGSNITTVNGLSKACLSCHDGTIGVGIVVKKNALGQDVETDYGADLVPTNDVDANGVLNPSAFQTSYNPIIGTDLSNDHPVSVQWTGAVTLAGLPAPASSTRGPDTSLGNGSYFPLFNGYLECGSCHDPHKVNPTLSLNDDRYLRDAKAKICTSCHSLK